MEKFISFNFFGAVWFSYLALLPPHGNYDAMLILGAAIFSYFWAKEVDIV